MSDSTFTPFPPIPQAKIQRQVELQAELDQCDLELIKTLRRRAYLCAKAGYNQRTRAERAQTAQLIEGIDALLRRLVNPS